MKLLDTVEMMNSNDFRERFKGEYYQLYIRIEGLKNMLISYENGTLTFEPKCSYELLKTQLTHMENYKFILEERAEIEGIEL